MWMAEIYNYAAGDTFVTFGTTETQTKEMAVKTYCKRYDMTDEDAKELGFENMMEYVENEKGIDTYQIRADGCYINREFMED